MPIALPILERLLRRVEVTASCWNWTGNIDKTGYGHIETREGKAQLVHRVAYQSLVGAIPDGKEMDHLCRNRRCVNPDHLEPVTRQENVRRGIAAVVNRARGQARTHCRNGHPYNEANTYIARSGKRDCRACWRERERTFAIVRAARSRERTHCPQGHPYDEINTYMFYGHRQCRECHRWQARR